MVITVPVTVVSLELEPGAGVSDVIEVSLGVAAAVAAGVAGVAEISVAALWLRATTKTAINTTPTITARTTRDEDF